MTASRDEILLHLHDYLRVAKFRDYAPQGLQIEGRIAVSKIVTGVSASLDLFHQAIAIGADMILVHHGMLWDRDPRVVRGGLKERLQMLLGSDVTLADYHLCLDAHPEIGNNALAARGLGLGGIEPWCEHNGRCIGFRGEWSGMPPKQAVGLVDKFYESRSLAFLSGPDPVRTVGIVSGGAQGELRQAIDAGLDMFITGEASEFVMHTAKEANIHFIAAGHYNTERIGIRALGDHLAARFGILHTFIDIPNPV